MSQAETFDLTQSEPPVKVTLGIAAGQTYEAGVGVELAKIGLEASIGTSLTYASSVSFEYTLPVGRRYAYRQRGGRIYYWI